MAEEFSKDTLRALASLCFEMAEYYQHEVEGALVDANRLLANHYRIIGQKWQSRGVKLSLMAGRLFK